MALPLRQPMRASILGKNHCLVFTINASSHVTQMDNPGNLRYCNVIKPTVIGTHFKNLLIRISEQIFRDSVRKPKYSRPETIASRGTTIYGSFYQCWLVAQNALAGLSLPTPALDLCVLFIAYVNLRGPCVSLRLEVGNAF